jgi:hypothetical protein
VAQHHKHLGVPGQLAMGQEQEQQLAAERDQKDLTEVKEQWKEPKLAPGQELEWKVSIGQEMMELLQGSVAHPAEKAGVLGFFFLELVR